MTDIYVRFRYSHFGFYAGDIVKCRLLGRWRGKEYIQVRFNSSPSSSIPFSVWSDISFEVIPEMEVLALAAEGRLDL